MPSVFDYLICSASERVQEEKKATPYNKHAVFIKTEKRLYFLKCILRNIKFKERKDSDSMY